MIRIRVPAVAAAAVLILAACSSTDMAPPLPGGPRTVADYARFPPPPPLRTGAQPGPHAGKDIVRELADLRALLRQLSADIDESQRHLAELQGELGRTRARIDLLLSGQASFVPGSAPPAEPAESRRPLVRIRFDRPGVEYADALRKAVEAALARLPDVAFDLVAVTSAADSGVPAADSGDEPQLYAEDIIARLIDMGIEPDRLSLSAAVSDVAGADELHLYIR